MESFYARSFALIAILVLGYLLYLMLAPLFAPIAWALFIAFLVHPLHVWLTGRLRGRGALSAALLTIAVLVLLIGPLAGLGTAFAKQAGDLLRQVQQVVIDHKPAAPSDLADLPLVGPALAWVEDSWGISFAQLQEWAVEGARIALKVLASLGRHALLGALGSVIGFAIMMFILFFAIRDARPAFERLHALVPLPSGERARLFGHLGSVTRAMVYGTGVTAVLQGALVAIGFSIVALPSPVVFGVAAAFCALIPLAGTPVVWVPAVVVLAIQGRYYAAAFLLAWGIFVTLIDNVLRPWLVSGQANVGALTVFIGVLGGVAAFGPIGVFLGPLLLALAIALIRFAAEVDPAGAAS